MLKKVLVANRGEIALRIIRACRDLGVESVAVYSEADRGLRHVIDADEAIEIGAAPAQESYLSIDRVIDAALESGADSIHPGYGFLAENAGLAHAATKAGLTFIGPPAQAIESLGSKLETRRIMIEAGVPVLPGTDASATVEDAQSAADEIGYPVLVKPSGGGGGRGMRVVNDRDELATALRVARGEAGRSFGDSDVYIEKLLTEARHIEVQILADAHGNVVHLGDRDCSLQRRHQKVVEEGPAPGLTAEQRETVRSCAVQAAKAAGYVSAGTVEFLYDGKEGFYLLEVNTRIQVEHGVTEAITGIDIVAEQIRVASGEKLGFSQEDVVLQGHAVECRVYAEDPTSNFTSSPGRIVSARFPAGPWVREDRSYDVGDEVTPYYDGMLAKLVVWGPTREVAIARTRRALAEYAFEGIATNVSFLRWIIDSDVFQTHRYDTRYIEREFRPEFLPEEPTSVRHAALLPTAAPAQTTATPARTTDTGGDRVFRTELFTYQRRSLAPPVDYAIHVAPLDGGGFEAVPVSPRDRHWANREFRRTGWSAEEAVHALIREVLSRKGPDEIFPELGMTY